MSETKFTSGPWELEQTEDGHVIRMGKAIENHSEFPSHLEIDYDHGCLLDGEEGDVFNEIEIKQAEEAYANARLIAAAPDMHKALNDILSHVENIPLNPHVLSIISIYEEVMVKAQYGERPLAMEDKT